VKDTTKRRIPALRITDDARAVLAVYEARKAADAEHGRACQAVGLRSKRREAIDAERDRARAGCDVKVARILRRKPRSRDDLVTLAIASYEGNGEARYALTRAVLAAAGVAPTARNRFRLALS
jgi:hypothetical protein